MLEKTTRKITPVNDNIVLKISTVEIVSYSIKNPAIKVMIGDMLMIVEKSPIETKENPYHTQYISIHDMVQLKKSSL